MPTDKEIPAVASVLPPLTPSANQPWAVNFFPTVILAFNQMYIIPETQASPDKLSPTGQVVCGAPPMSSPATAISSHCWVPCCLGQRQAGTQEVPGVPVPAPISMHNLLLFRGKEQGAVQNTSIWFSGGCSEIKP